MKLDTLALAAAISSEYAALPQVVAVALGGSRSSAHSDSSSDIDLYVFTDGEIGAEARADIATKRGENAEIDNQFWEPGDEWDDKVAGVHIDVMFRDIRWIEEQIDRVLGRHEASTGYSTAFWYNVLTARPLFDRDGRFHRLQQRSQLPYPDALVAAIVAKNYPILRRSGSSYLRQLASAIARDDLVAINHRIAALLASYFDIVFAINRVPHPGEKRIIDRAERLCEKTPDDMRADVAALISMIPQRDQSILGYAERLIDGLDQLLLRVMYPCPVMDTLPTRKPYPADQPE